MRACNGGRFRFVVLDLQILKGFLHLLATGFLCAAAHPRRGRLRARGGDAAALRGALAGQDRIEEDPSHTADREPDQQEQGEMLHLHGS